MEIYKGRQGIALYFSYYFFALFPVMILHTMNVQFLIRLSFIIISIFTYAIIET
jgi:hypothetical protein